ncbi:MAG: YbhB/YbcL family Raf kinase inhibitor-like protein [Euzebyales bacterium]|nr:YbhB/YbcL family Raf kinase inhibitor-like protein [Euzebyales bacterium]MDQ3342116.1 YbhB/YbcL family Raf kinase inhibitor-like protein [Actinomycetota bacterium]
MAAFRLFSPAFEHDRPLPGRYAGEDEGVSPPLQWTGVPAGTKELLIVCDDPDTDTGVVTHWIVFAIAPDAEGLPEALPRDAYLEEPIELVQGLNEFDEVGYSGPEPDDDRGPHRIFFRIYALDAELTQLSPGATRNELRQATKGHVLGGAELVGIA